MPPGRQYPPPPGLHGPSRNSARFPPPSSQSQHRSEPYRPPGSRHGGGGGSGGRGRDRNRNRSRGGGDGGGGGGWDGRDSHDHRDNRRDDPPRDARGDNYHPLPPRPPSPSRHGQGFRGGDSGPAPPRGDFTFRAPKPAGVHEAQQHGDSYTPQGGRNYSGDRDYRGPPSGPRFQQGYPGNDYRGDRRGDRHGDRRNDRRDPRRGGRGGRGGFARFIAANRPILQQASQNEDDEQEDYAKDQKGHTYLNLDDLSDSDEAEMDISGAEGAGDDDDDAEGRPARKRARVSKTADGNAAPKWSNPDPYTVLPPTETGPKKKDMVHLIRKARVQAEKSPTDALADMGEFISCDMDSDDDGGDDDGSDDDIVVIDDVDDDDDDGEVRSERAGRDTDRGAMTKQDRPVLAGGASAGSLPLRGNAESAHSNTTAESAAPLSRTAQKGAAKAAKKKEREAAALNPSRKRTHDDEFKLPEHAKLKKATSMPAVGFVLPGWHVKKKEERCPWLRDHSDTPVMSAWLHKEIVDFYDHIKPRAFEERLRQDLIDELERSVRRRFNNARVFCFGSFMSGLYLPTGDMDIVMCSTNFLGNRAPVFAKKNVLFKFGNFLCTNRMADREHLEHITKAKVPLVKYVDMRTWLKVDVSFENMTGVAAIDTFTRWKEQYPMMPTLVTLIKQFLTMRGLNEPVNGGIGGFSMICLVVSMLQLMPPVQSEDMNGEHHLGDLLMHFFDLYGNKFNYETTAISLNPPGYVPKSKVTNFVYKNVDRLSIIDPNNPQNDISGGSRNTPAIMRAFSDAHEAIRKNMARVAGLPEAARKNQSLLGVIFEGDYSSYREQREHMRDLYYEIYQKEPVD